MVQRKLFSPTSFDRKEVDEVPDKLEVRSKIIGSGMNIKIMIFSLFLAGSSMLYYSSNKGDTSSDSGQNSELIEGETNLLKDNELTDWQRNREEILKKFRRNTLLLPTLAEKEFLRVHNVKFKDCEEYKDRTELWNAMIEAIKTGNIEFYNDLIKILKLKEGFNMDDFADRAREIYEHSDFNTDFDLAHPHSKAIYIIYEFREYFFEYFNDYSSFLTESESFPIKDMLNFYEDLFSGRDSPYNNYDESDPKSYRGD